jgi:peptide-methionine (S)-S-oxide reductase
MGRQGIETIVLGGGCFWCLEASYAMIRGVVCVSPGYAGGHDDHPSYYRVCQGNTGHAEVVEVAFDPSVITLSQILEVFWTIHDPTTPNRQGNDVGSEYRSIILCSTEDQLELVRRSLSQNQQYWPQPIITQVGVLQKYYPAEEEHVNYFAKHPERAYCQLVINPKLTKLQLKFADLLKHQ